MTNLNEAPSLRSIKLASPHQGVQLKTWKCPHDILYSEIIKNASTDCGSQLTQLLELLEIVEGNKIFGIVDLRNSGQISKVEREFGQKKIVTELVGAAAFIISNPLSKIIGNFYIGLNKAACPLKLFFNFESAYCWISLQKRIQAS